MFGNSDSRRFSHAVCVAAGNLERILSLNQVLSSASSFWSNIWLVDGVHLRNTEYQSAKRAAHSAKGP